MIMVHYYELEFTHLLALVCVAGQNSLYTQCVTVMYKNSVPSQFLYKYYIRLRILAADLDNVVLNLTI